MGVVADADAFRELCSLAGTMYVVSLLQLGDSSWRIETVNFYTDVSYHQHTERHTSRGKTLHEALHKAVAGDWDVEEAWDEDEDS